MHHPLDWIRHISGKNCRRLASGWHCIWGQSALQIEMKLLWYRQNAAESQFLSVWPLWFFFFFFFFITIYRTIRSCSSFWHFVNRWIALQLTPNRHIFLHTISSIIFASIVIFDLNEVFVLSTFCKLTSFGGNRDEFYIKSIVGV